MHEDQARMAMVTGRVDAFVDAAFAFAVTLLVIAVGQPPTDVAGLVQALRGIPAFAAGFALLLMFWWTHLNWRRLYALRDGTSVLLSLLLVFLVLVYVYPTRMVFSSFFNWLSGGWLSQGMGLRNTAELTTVFVIYHLAWTTLGLVAFALYVHAWRRREALRLDAQARSRLRGHLASSAMVPATGLLALVVSLLLWAVGAKAFVPFTGTLYALMGFSGVVAARAQRQAAE